MFSALKHVQDPGTPLGLIWDLFRPRQPPPCYHPVVTFFISDPTCQHSNPKWCVHVGVTLGALQYPPRLPRGPLVVVLCPLTAPNINLILSV